MCHIGNVCHVVCSHNLLSLGHTSVSLQKSKRQERSYTPDVEPDYRRRHRHVVTPPPESARNYVSCLSTYLHSQGELISWLRWTKLTKGVAIKARSVGTQQITGMGYSKAIPFVQQLSLNKLTKYATSNVKYLSVRFQFKRVIYQIKRKRKRVCRQEKCVGKLIKYMHDTLKKYILI